MPLKDSAHPFYLKLLLVTNRTSRANVATSVSVSELGQLVIEVCMGCYTFACLFNEGVKQGQIGPILV